MRDIDLTRRPLTRASAIAGTLFVVLALAASCASHSMKPKHISLFEGTWTGSAGISRHHGKPRVEIELKIRADGSVEGTVGDATLRNGRIRRRGEFFRTVDRTDYQIVGGLEGSLIESTKVRCLRVRMIGSLVGTEEVFNGILFGLAPMGRKDTTRIRSLGLRLERPMDTANAS